MTTNSVITIYHFDECKDSYVRSQITNASIYKKRQIADEKGGMHGADEATIRIPTSNALNVSCGDYVYIGRGGSICQKDKCYCITAVSDNRRGSLKHWRIDCDKKM